MNWINNKFIPVVFYFLNPEENVLFFYFRKLLKNVRVGQEINFSLAVWLEKLNHFVLPSIDHH